MYFGSVRFFRHLIITVILIMFLLPIFCAVFFGIKCSVIQKEVSDIGVTVNSINAVEPDEMKSELMTLSASISEQITNLQSSLEASIIDQPPVIEQNFNQSISRQLTDFQKQVIAPIIEQLDSLKVQLDDSMAVQAAAISKQLTSSQIAEMELKLEDLGTRLQSIEQNIAYIETVVSQYIQENSANP